MEQGYQSRLGGEWRLLRCAAVLVIVISAAACSVALYTPPPGTGSFPPSPPATGPTGYVASPSDTFGNGSPAPLLTGAPLPSLGAAPAGPWTGVDWVAIPGGYSPTLSGSVDLSGPEVSLEGSGNSCSSGPP